MKSLVDLIYDGQSIKLERDLDIDVTAQMWHSRTPNSPSLVNHIHRVIYVRLEESLHEELVIVLEGEL